jgi:hypothetical protein
VSGVASSLLALARALHTGQVTPTEAADRLVILAHRVHIDATQVKISSVRDGMPALSTTGDGD